ncbi:Transcription factor MYB1R1 [Hibiscus syriacus]|uniref:Transcription factor MYB1R1 n=2 Tax=Hibiscus syriacus TaxID=106335 RepID=A0A6A2YDW8_HIBSY|nr:Transcription factor MYB1R1 [Hibiscus syriacus]
MGNLSSAHYHSPSSAAASPNPDSFLLYHVRHPNHDPCCYLSDDLAARVSTNHRGEIKKGIPWTEEEHRLFLVGLQTLGKGDWRGIARMFVMSRTSTQVASHAQKYFTRQNNFTPRKRHSSLFDMAANTPEELEELVGMSQLSIRGAENGHREPSPPSLKLHGEPSRESHLM